MRSPMMAATTRGFAGLALAAVLSAGCAAQPTLSSATASPAASPTASPTVGASPLTEADFEDIVLAAGAAPVGMNHDATEEGNIVLTRPILNRDGYDLGQVIHQPGFVAGRYAEFSGDAGLLLSWGALFDTTDNAETSFALYLAELRSPDAYGFAADVPAGLGDEGYCDEGDVGGPDGLHEWICLWRVDNAVLAVGGAPADVVRDTAEGMDDRAR